MRVIALLLLIVYHLAISFQPFASPAEDPYTIWVYSDESVDLLWFLLQALNVWRIPILFVVSGMGVRFAMERRGMRRLVGERSLRLGVPLVFGSYLINPLFFVFADIFYGREVTYAPSPLHLWFLVFILLYAVALAPLLYYLKSRPRNLLLRGWGRVMRWPLGLGLLLLLGLPLAVEAVLISPEFYSEFATFIPDSPEALHGPLVGLICFGAGFLFISRQGDFWPVVRRAWLALLPLAVLLFAVRVSLWEVEGLLLLRNGLTAVEAASWMLSALGLGAYSLNRRSRLLSYLSAAVFPVYIFHFPLQNLVGLVLYPLPLPGYVEFAVAVAATVGGCLLLYEGVRRLPKARLAFGLRA